MGSIPVAGAKKTDGKTVGLFGTRTPNPSLRAKRAKMGSHPRRRTRRARSHGGNPKDICRRRNSRQIVLFIICLLYNFLKSTSFFLKPIDIFRIPLYNNMPLEIGSFLSAFLTPPKVQRV